MTDYRPMNYRGQLSATFPFRKSLGRYINWYSTEARSTLTRHLPTLDRDLNETRPIYQLICWPIHRLICLSTALIRHKIQLLWALDFAHLEAIAWQSLKQVIPQQWVPYAQMPNYQWSIVKAIFIELGIYSCMSMLVVCQSSITINHWL